MGNAALCAPSIKILSSTDGELLFVHTKAPVKAAEIMLENPGQFVCASSDLKVGQRIPGMCAEEELEKGKFHFFLPMEMLYSVLTKEELKILTRKAAKGMKRRASIIDFSKVFPEFNSCLFSNHHNSKDCSEIFKVVDEDDDDEDGLAGGVRRYSRQRSWQPALETIVETHSPYA